MCESFNLSFEPFILERMKLIIVYATKGRSGKIVAEKIKENLNLESSIICLNDGEWVAENLMFDWLFLVCPTYGDAELESAMEKFLVGSLWEKFRHKNYSICELGLYRGYEERVMGAGRLIDQYLKEQGMIRQGNVLSLDSLPLDDLWLIEKWTKLLI